MDNLTPHIDQAILVMTDEHGPDFDLLGKFRHVDSLNRMLVRQPQRRYSSAASKVAFFITVGGGLEHHSYSKPIESRYRNSRILSNSVLYISFGLGRREMDLPDGEFREMLASLFETSAGRALAYLQRKSIEFDREAFLADLGGALAEYRSLPLPLPPTKSELETARFFEGE